MNFAFSFCFSPYVTSSSSLCPLPLVPLLLLSLSLFTCACLCLAVPPYVQTIHHQKVTQVWEMDRREEKRWSEYPEQLHFLQKCLWCIFPNCAKFCHLMKHDIVLGGAQMNICSLVILYLWYASWKVRESVCVCVCVRACIHIAHQTCDFMDIIV